MTSPVVVSPKIVKLKWGSILVQAVDEAGHLVPGEVTKYRDAKLWPGGSRAWIWKVHGTTHRRGVTLEDLEEFKHNGTRTVVIGMGRMSCLHVPHQVLDDLQNYGFKVIVKQSYDAMETYNLLVDKGHAVGGLFHTTC